MPQACDPGFCDASELMGGRRRVGQSKERSDVTILMGKYQIILAFEQVKKRDLMFATVLEAEWQLI